MSTPSTAPSWSDPGLHVAAPGVDPASLGPFDDAVLVAVCRLGPHPDKRELLTALADALHLPAWFGRNWDALADCLADLTGHRVLILEGTARLATETRDTLVEILARAAVASARGASPLSVVLTESESGAADGGEAGAYGTTMEGSTEADDNSTWLDG